MLFFGKKDKEAAKPARPTPASAPPTEPAARPASPTSRSRDAHTAPEPAKKLMGQLLVEEGIISDGQLKEALEKQKATGVRLVECLVELGYVKQDVFERLMARQPGVASIDLDQYRIPEELVSMIPREFAEKNEVFPIDKLGKLMTVGMACPLDKTTIDALQEMTGLRVKGMLCSLEDIRLCIERYYPKVDSAAG